MFHVKGIEKETPYQQRRSHTKNKNRITLNALIRPQKEEGAVLHKIKDIERNVENKIYQKRKKLHKKKAAQRKMQRRGKESPKPQKRRS